MTPPQPRPTRRRRTSAGDFRPEIQGLRAVAVGAVLLAHAGVPFARGGFAGVDVFFVISGYLITRLLVTELERSDRIDLAVFYARRIKRLLPLAVTVLFVTVVLSVLILSPVAADSVAHDVVAAGLYVLNWRYRAEAVDYFSTGAAHSPLQHYWSLAVEEQFYLVWPALLLAVAWVARRRGIGLRRAIWVTLAGLTVLSFVWAIHSTAVAQQAAYFSTPARAWELGLGGLLALGLSGRQVPAAWAERLAWGGAVAIVATTLFDGPRSGFPGPAALLPTLGTAALIAAGTSPVRSAPVRLLDRRPLQHVGRLSYSWYLWHWPFLVFATAAFGHLSVFGGLLVVALSIIPAGWSHRHIEEPVRRSPLHRRAPRRALAGAPAGALLALIFGAGLSLALPSTPTLAARDARGARAVHSGAHLQTAANALRPNPLQADHDRSRVWDDGCLVSLRDTRSGPCAYGVPGSHTRAILFGDSHAMQQYPALEKVALRRRWRLEVLAKAGCSPALNEIHQYALGREFSECDAWRSATLARIAAERPALVVVSSSTRYTVDSNGRHLHGPAAREALSEGYAVTLKKLKATGAQVVVIRDTPRPPFSVPDCVSEHLHSLRDCAFPLASAVVPDLEARAVRLAGGGIPLLDEAPEICPDGKTCPAVIGNVLVYRNTSHLTATYSATMANWLEARLPRTIPPSAATPPGGARATPSGSAGPPALAARP